MKIGYWYISFLVVPLNIDAFLYFYEMIILLVAREFIWLELWFKFIVEGIIINYRGLELV